MKLYQVQQEKAYRGMKKQKRKCSENVTSSRRRLLNINMNGSSEEQGPPACCCQCKSKKKLKLKMKKCSNPSTPVTKKNTTANNSGYTSMKSTNKFE